MRNIFTVWKIETEENDGLTLALCNEGFAGGAVRTGFHKSSLAVCLLRFKAQGTQMYASKWIQAGSVTQILRLLICYELLALWMFKRLFDCCCFLLLFFARLHPIHPHAPFVYVSVAFTINHVSMSVSVSLSVSGCNEGRDVCAPITLVPLGDQMLIPMNIIIAWVPVRLG